MDDGVWSDWVIATCGDEGIPRRFNIGHVIGTVGMTVKAPGSWPIGDAVRIS